MRNIYDIISELRNHPDCIDLSVYTLQDFANNYSAELETFGESGGLEPDDLEEIIYNGFTEKDKVMLRYFTQDWYDVVNDVVDKNVYGSIEDLEVINIVKRHIKLKNLLED